VKYAATRRKLQQQRDRDSNRFKWSEHNSERARRSIPLHLSLVQIVLTAGDGSVASDQRRREEAEVAKVSDRIATLEGTIS
jgi:hypothetical protein